jgi:hypothetical protein
MREKKVSKFSWVSPFIIFIYLVFLGVFLIYYQVRVHKLERQVINLEANNEELIYDIDDVFDEVDDEFEFIEKDIRELNKRIDNLEDELKNQQEHYAELIEDYYKLVAEKAILEDRLIQEREDAKGIYTEEDIRYAIDIFATYLVEYPPNWAICVYENETLFLFKMVNDELVLDEMLSYNELKELWLNK